MRLGIDWVSMGIFVVAYAISQVNSIPLKIRYAVLSLACLAIAAFRAKSGLTTGTNLIFTGFAGVLCVYYLIRTMTARDQPRRAPGDDD